MRFRLSSAWSLHGGTWIAPAGTIIDFAKNDKWAQRVKGKVIPLDAVPLDAEAYELQLKTYPDHRHLLGGAWEDK